MKKFSKILSVALLVALVLSLGVANAFADVNITINRDDSYDSTATGNREYTYYWVFRATTGEGGATSTGGGVSEDEDGNQVLNPVTTTAENGISYYLNTTEDANVIAKFATNDYFTLTPTADGSKQIVSWKNASQTAETVQAAANWILENKAYISSETLTANGATWTATVPEGYYVIKGSEGANLVAATTSITIKEKNTYPTIDKKQNDKSATDEYKNDDVNVKVGDKIYYQVVVSVPADANKPIAVLDKMSTGLTYDGNLVATVDGTTIENYTPMTSAEGNPEYRTDITATNGWQVKFADTAVVGYQGKDIVFTFSATVNDSALIDTGRENEVTLKYDNDHYVMHDKVDYIIGAAAVVKYDGATAEVKNNELALKEGATSIKYLQATFKLTDAAGNAINVTGADGVYKVDPTSKSNEVVSNKTADGGILIYGLDPDVSYKLTETATESGYNVMSGAADLTVVPSTKRTVDSNVLKSIKVVAGKLTAGSTDTNAETLTITPQQLAKVENNTGSVLPSTGGIGTTIFYVVGGVLVLAAIILLVTKKRMSE